MGYELEKQLEMISEYLDSDDIGNQVMALKSLEHTIFGTELTQKQIEPLLGLIKKRLEVNHSPIRTDLIRVACLLGKYNFIYIKDFYPVLYNELTTKNRFRIQIILDLIAHLANTNIPPIVQTVKDIMLNWKQWFSESYLVPQFHQFIDQMTEQGFTFIKDNEEELKRLVTELPESMKDLKEIIDTRIKNYHDFLAEEAKRKADEERVREQREQENQKIEKERQRRLRIKNEEYKRRIEDLINDSGGKVLQEEEVPPIDEEREERRAGIRPTFTKSGLKRTDPSKEGKEY